VLVDPYGGPHALRAVRSHLAHLTSQWFANQGFAVVVSDNRGTPGRGTDWERAVHFDLATAVLDDQVDAVEQAAAEYGCLDLERVAIRGWSFGGYLAALAVLLRPDRFHAAIAGAPVTEWRLYDTHYTERYLGHPDERADAYDGSSLLPLAGGLSRPLLLIHGLADDNVMAVHTLQLSSALLAAGRPHEVLPLVGVTHMTPQEVVAENLLLHQLDFLRRAFREASAADRADGYGAG
jgi:dipeptidyl-peptidase-4